MNEKFLNSIRELIGEDEMEDFIHAFVNPSIRSLRINSLKISPQEFRSLCPMPLETSPFSDDGYVYDSEVFLAGLSPFHHAGLYYILDPSAFAAIEYLRPYIGERVLDICAAPGGKATYCASLLKNDSFIVANDVEHTRAKILSQNIERLGITNSLITANTPEFFERNYPEFFDTIIVDPPCTGDNLTKNTDQFIYDRYDNGIGAYFVRQSKILNCAAESLCIGGHLLYTTSALNTVENEEVINRFLATHDFEIVPIPESLKNRVRSGFNMEAVRIFPHDGGDGHFSCVLKKLSGDGDYPEIQRTGFIPLEPEVAAQASKVLADICDKDFGELHRRDKTLFAFTQNLPIVEGLNILRAGLKVAEIKPDGSITPAHALAMTLKADQSKKNIDFPFFSPQIKNYLAGLDVEAEIPYEGWGTISLSGYCTGRLISETDKIVNKYPKGLRFFTK